MLKKPAAIIGTAFLSTTCAALAAISTVKSLEKLPAFQIAGEPRKASPDTVPGRAPPSTGGVSAPPEPSSALAMQPWGWVLLLAFVGVFAWFFVV
jgi:hypothetical protein